ncbi:hypothetical protein NTE19_003314 [Vibrio fluvialis]|nr:hypothetical protein [Vibrio fluvialis]
MATKTNQEIRQIAPKIVKLLCENGEMDAQSVQKIIKFSQSTTRAVANALIRAGILYRAEGRQAIYGFNKSARTDAFYCVDCKEWNALELIDSHGDCRLCGGALRPRSGGNFKITGSIITTDLSKPCDKPLSAHDQKQYDIARKFRNIQMSM